MPNPLSDTPPNPPPDAHGHGVAWLIQAISAGALSAVFMAGLGVPSILSLLMFLLLPVPPYMVGLAFGWSAAAVAALVAFVALVGMVGLHAAAAHVLLVGAPVTWLTCLALQHRPATGGGEGEATDEEGEEWYPEGRLLLWIAALAAVAVSLILLSQGFTAQQIEASLRRLAQAALTALGVTREATEAQVKTMVETFVAIAPVSVVVMWVLTLYPGFRLADWLIRKMRLARRPRAAFSRLTFPRKSLSLIALASLAAFLPDVFGLIGEVFAVAFMSAWALLGLAVVHAFSAGQVWRPAALAATYTLLVLLTGLCGPLLTLLGLAETAFGLRREQAQDFPTNST